MIKRCIMIFPSFENEDIIHEIRSKYDPLALHVKPHITLVFPFESCIETDILREHIETILKGIKPFRLCLKGITSSKSTENYLFLNLVDGIEVVKELHKKLYTGILEKFYPKWLNGMNYFPHMTIGNIENEELFHIAFENTKGIDDMFITVIDKISVENIDENEDSIIEMEIKLHE